MQNLPEWLPLLIAVVCGGLGGAIVTNIVNTYRGRKQPISYKIEIVDVFKRNPEFPSLMHGIWGDPQKPLDAGVLIDNLSIARVTVINKGNKDFEKFAFGLTFEEGNHAIHAEAKTIDRHHLVEILPEVSVDNSAAELDVVLRPFNRNETYLIEIQYLYKQQPGIVTIGTAEAVRLVEIGAASEAMKEIAIEAFKRAAKNSFPKI